MTAAMMLLRTENYLVNHTSQLHNKISRLAAPYKEYPAYLFAEYLGELSESDSLSKKRFWGIVRSVPEQYQGITEVLLGLSVLYALIPASREAFREAGIAVSIETAYRISTGERGLAEDVSAIYKVLSPYFLRTPKETEWYGEAKLCADIRLMDYLTGNDVFSPEIRELCTLAASQEDLPALYLYEEYRAKAAAFWLEKKAVLQIRGEVKSGKRFLFRHIARECRQSVLFADFRMFSAMDQEKCRRSLRLLLREALFYKSTVCWYHIDESALENRYWSSPDFAARCIQTFLQAGVQVCCCTEKGLDLTEHLSEPVCILDLPPLTRAGRIQLWQSFCAAEGCTEIDPMQFAIRYKFSCGQIAAVFQRRRHHFSVEEQTEKQIFEEICTRIASPSEKLFYISHSDYQFEDLKLPKHEKDLILEICANFRYSHQVYTQWQMEQKMPYGRCTSVLLTGPPGTGKTMTAHVIANMLELPLFHADLSQITDKYIGETEKHLDAIFTEAEKSNCVLLLDEADAICGKRSEVSESRDRYANNDTAFILQRLERYDGLVVLATNFINNLDNAFMRRMKYILQFSLPSASVRREIWKSCFTDAMPVAETLDFDYLAEQFQFAGANIKNVVLASAFLAASEGCAITMRHILKSVGNEYLKFQKHALSGEFGKYSDLYRKILEERES